MRKGITGSKKQKVKTKFADRQIASHLQERYYYTYDIKNIIVPEGKLFIIDRQMRVVRLKPWNDKSPLEKKSINLRKKIYKSTVSQNLKKETARNEKN